MRVKAENSQVDISYCQLWIENLYDYTLSLENLQGFICNFVVHSKIFLRVFLEYHVKDLGVITILKEPEKLCLLATISGMDPWR